MQQITVDFRNKNLGTVARQGEHNKTELVFTLPDDFAGADYINAEFELADKNKVVMDNLTPSADNTLTVPVVQAVTACRGSLGIQLVAYAVDGAEIVEIAKSPIVKGYIDRSIEATEPADTQPGFIESLQAWARDARDKLAELWELRHGHSNKATIDELHSAALETPEPEITVGGMADPYRDQLSFRGQYLRMINDGGVIQGAEEVTVSGRKYLRLKIFYDPAVETYDIIEIGQNARPRFIDIPIASAQDSTIVDGGVTLNGTEISLGLDSVEQEIIEIQEDLSVLPDWNENDTTQKSYIQNRTHWAETGTVFTDHTVEWLGTTPTYQAQPWAADDLGITLNEGETYTLQAAGATITCACQKMTMTDQGLTQDYYFIGNLHIYDPSAEDNGFPMLLAVDNMWRDDTIIKTWNIVLTSDTLFGSDLSFRLGKAATVYHPLSMNYIPDAVNDAVKLKHTHENQAVLNQLDIAYAFGVSNPVAVSHDGIPLDGWTAASFSGSDVSIALYANCLYDHALSHDNQTGEPVYLSSLEITGFQNPASIRAPEYFIEFTTGATAPTLTLPASVEWANEPTIEAKKHYQISILNNVALWCAVDVEVTS